MGKALFEYVDANGDVSGVLSYSLCCNGDAVLVDDHLTHDRVERRLGEHDFMTDHIERRATVSEIIAQSRIYRLGCDSPATLELVLSDWGDGWTWGTVTLSSPRKAGRPAGSYYVYGHYDPQSRQLDLTPGPWIVQSPDFSPARLTTRPSTAIFSQLIGTCSPAGCKFLAARIDQSADTLGQPPKEVLIPMQKARLAQSGK